MKSIPRFKAPETARTHAEVSSCSLVRLGEWITEIWGACILTVMLLALLCFCLEVAAIPQPYVVVKGFSIGETQDGGQGQQVNLEYCWTDQMC